MTRKDYVLIAEALLRETPLAQDGDRAMRLFIRMCNRFANTLSVDNPRFDRSRFLRACGVKS